MLVLLVLAGLALACGGGGEEQPADAEAQVRQAVDEIRIAIQLDDWKTVYRSFTDEFRKQCKEADFVVGASAQGSAFKAVKLDIGEVTVEGDSATVNITFSNGEETPGEWNFVREGGDWHLESAPGTEGCGFATPAPAGNP